MTNARRMTDACRMIALIAVACCLGACSIAERYPGGSEQQLASCHDDADNDHDGLTDCADLDCAEFCVEDNAERCADGVDDDEDGATDCADPSCAAVCGANPTAPRLDFVDADGTAHSPAMPPMLTPCLEGWRERVADSGVTVCEPWPGEGPDTCADGEVHVPGTAGCAPLGAGCAAGDFPEFSGGAVLYVRSGALGGDGSRALPFGTIGEALAGLDVDTGQIALAQGDYALGSVRVERALTMAGVCAALTHLQGSLEVSDASVTLRSLRIGGGAAPAITAVEDSTISLDSVDVMGATGVGVRMVRSSLLAVDSLFRDTRPEPFTGEGGQGVTFFHSPATLSRVVVEGNTSAGLETIGMSSVVNLHDVSVRDTAGSRGAGGFLSGFGLYGRDQGTFAGAGVVVEDNAGSALHLVNRGGARLENSVIRSPAVQRAAGVSLKSGASLTLERSQVRVIAGSGVDCADSTLSLNDVLLEGATSNATGLIPAVSVAGPQAESTLARVVIDRRASAGLFAGANADLEVQDLEIADSMELGTEALQIRDGAQVQLERLHVVRGLHGLASDSLMDNLVATHVSVTDAWFESPLLQGVLNLEGAQFEGRNILIQGSRGVGVASRGGDLTLTDFAIRDVTVDDIGCGRGVDMSGGRVVMRRGEVTGAPEAGVILSASGGTVRDVVIRLDQRPCVDTCAGSDAATHGVGFARYSASVDAPELVITDARVELAGACGIQLNPAAGDAWLRTMVSDTGASLCLVGPEGALPEGIRTGDGVNSSVRASVLPLPGCTPSTNEMSGM